MRKIIYLLLFLCLIFVCCIRVSGIDSKFPLLGKIIVIDVGHGGKDSGAVYENIKEKDINLVISKKIESRLIGKGASVILIRNDDYDLSSPGAVKRKKSDFDNRIRLINNSNADLYLSIHLNVFSDSKYRGPQVFYSNVLESNKFVAKIMQNNLNNFTSTKRNEKIIFNTYMFDKLNIPGVLIECGFLSNYFDRINLVNEDYQNNLSEVIINTIIEYFSKF